MNTHHRIDPSSPWGGVGSSGVGSENGFGVLYLSSFPDPKLELADVDIDAYHDYTSTKSTIINYASTAEGLASDDWFRESGGEVRYG